VIIPIRQQSPEKTSSFQQIPITDMRFNSRPLTTFHLQNNNNNNDNDDDDDDEEENLNIHQKLNTITPQRQHTRQISNDDSVRSGIHDLTSRTSPISPIKTNNQQKLTITSPYQQQQQDDKISHHTSSITSSSRHSSDRFPPPPQNLEIFDPTATNNGQQRSTSSMSYRSSIIDDVHTPEVSTMTQKYIYNIFKSSLDEINSNRTFQS
jgi:hypothetical protein